MTLPDIPSPPSSLNLRIDGAALAANWQVLNRLSGRAQAGAAVKADAYGLGVAQVAPVLRQAGARQFFVAHWAEVAPLLHHVPAEEIAVLHGPVTAREAAYGRDLGVRPVINSLHQAALWLAAGGGACDVMVDTGMNRLGLEQDQLGDDVLRQLEIDTLHSHLADADEDTAINAIQLSRFEAACAAIPAKRRSLANSAGVALGPRFAFDLTRPGLALYGGIPRDEFAGHIRQVAYPQTSVIQLRQVEAGERIGYNGIYTSPRPMRLATVALGYADGYLRSWTGHGTLAFGGVELPLVGRVSMDLAIVDCTACPALREGDRVDVTYDLPQAARATGLSQYELLTGLGARFARHG